MLKMENLEMLNKPSVQHVAAKIRLKLLGQTMFFRLKLFPLLSKSLSIPVVVSVSDVTFGVRRDDGLN